MAARRRASSGSERNLTRPMPSVLRRIRAAGFRWILPSSMPTLAADLWVVMSQFSGQREQRSTFVHPNDVAPAACRAANSHTRMKY